MFVWACQTECAGLHAQVNCDTLPLGPENPHGVGFTATETGFESELQAIREVDPRRSRVWKIKNEFSRNPITGADSLLL
jgi:primary-amine oxidase